MTIKPGTHVLPREDGTFVIDETETSPWVIWDMSPMRVPLPPLSEQILEILQRGVSQPINPEAPKYMYLEGKV